MSKKLIAALVALVLIIVGGFIVVSGTDDDEGEEATNTANQQAEPQNNQAEETAETLQSDYLGDYTLNEQAYGTQVTVVVDEAAGTRTITSNALPNHETGTFPNDANPNTISAQSASYEYPLNPVFTGTPLDVGTPGVSLNGVKFEPGTAETFTCTSGELYRVEAIQDLTSLGLDTNNAHVQPTGEYHYHGVSTMMAEAFDNGNDLVHVGFAADGHMVYYSKSGAYKSSYELGSGQRSGSGCTFSISSRNVAFSTTKDGSITSDWDYVEGLGQLDECNGITIDGEYIYLMTEEFPYISRCLMGEATQTGPGGGGGGGAPPSGGPSGGAPQGMPPRQ